MTKHTGFTLNHLSLAVLALALSAAAGSAVAATVSASSTSTVVTPMNVTKASDLSFGSFAATAAPGTVTIRPDGTRAVDAVIGLAGATTAAKFDATGSGNATYSISFAGSSTSLTSGGNSMAFTRIADTSASTITSGDVTTGTLSSGAQSVYVGGVLTVAANQAPGTYSGTVQIAVDYN